MLERIVSALIEGRNRSKPATVLVGAGCSQSAGIPLARDIVTEVKKQYPHTRNVADTYPAVMAALDDGPRYRVLRKYVESAKVNWAHVLLSWLVKEGYVGRILTTNFDNLLLRACSLHGVNPAVYDLATSKKFSAGEIQDPAIFYLHGQYRGFIQFHRPEEVQSNAMNLRPIFQLQEERAWIVVGYSGDCDPVFENLAEINRFLEGLYWVTFREESPAAHVTERLLKAKEQVRVVKGFDADSFFLRVVRCLGIEMPSFIRDPFSHMLSVIETIPPLPGEQRNAPSEATDVTQQARRLLESARDSLVAPAPRVPEEIASDESIEAKIMELRVQGKGDQIIAEYEKRMADRSAYFPMSTELRRVVAWAYSERGAATGADDDFARAVAISPAPAEVLSQWGTALLSAFFTDGNPSLLERAQHRYQDALERQPNYPPALYGLACVHALGGDAEQALGWLKRRQTALADLRSTSVTANPMFKGIINDPALTGFLHALDMKEKDEKN